MKTVARAIDFLLIGGGLASATAAETLRLEGAQGAILILGAEDRPPYHRPSLLAGLAQAKTDEPLAVLRDEEYRQLGVECLTGVRAVRVDAQRRLVYTDRAGTLAYGTLLVATGASPLRPRMRGAGLPGIHLLRTAADQRAILEAASPGRRCVVIGAGFIGMEVSSTLRRRGLDVRLVAGKGGVFGPLRDPTIARFFTELYAAHGIEVVSENAAAFEGTRAVEAVVLEGGRRLACDFVVVGIGVRADVDFLQGSGIELNDGVVVDRHLRASAPDAYAAGDVASFFDPVFNVRRRIEHWDNAVKQGRLAAKNMLGQRLPYDDVSGFFCHVFDVNFQFLGMAEHAPRRQALGTPDAGSWARLFLEDSVPRGLFTVARPARETATIEALIRYRTSLDRIEAELARPGFVLTDIPSQTVLVLQGGGAMGAFECGLIKSLEEQAIHPDIVAGVSIGAFNGAIVASHPRHATEALESFWRDLAVATPHLGNEAMQMVSGSMAALWFGVPHFFTPRWLNWSANPWDLLRTWVSFYDPTPVRALLARYVDFEALKSSPVRLLVSAVNVETGQLEVFDSYVDDFSVDHLLASGSLPPGFPWTTIDGKHYWDGGIVSNSPLEQVIERCGDAGKTVIVVDLFPHERPLPTNLLEVAARRDEIVYAERIRRADNAHELLRTARKLVENVLSLVDEATAARIRELPPYVHVMGAPAPPSITRIVRRATPGEPVGRDFDFSERSIRALQSEGYEESRRAFAGKSASVSKADDRLHMTP